MITEQEEINNTIICYEEEFGLNYNQDILTQISLKNDLFNGKDVESILNIFLFENFDNEECYLDEKHEFVDYDYLNSNPQEIEQLILDNYSYY